MEVGALQMLFEEAGWKPGDGARTALGSVKANIGHTMSAAGIAGLIKAALALHHKALPPQPSVAEENPKLELPRGPFFLPRGEMAWERGEHPRRAGVSSFGFGGTNAHLALEEAPQPPRTRRAAVPLRKARAELFMLAGGRASVDTTLPEVAEHALRQGATMINSVSLEPAAELGALAARFGADLVLTKPCLPDEVAKAIRQLLGSPTPRRPPPSAAG